MQIKRIIYIISILLLVTTINAAENPFTVTPDNGFSSHSLGTFSPLINPTYSDFGMTSEIAYQYMKYENYKKANHFISTNFLGFSFIYGRYENIFSSETNSILESKADYYNISKGVNYGDIIGLGFSYSFSKSDIKNYNEYKSYNFGFILRPIRYFSLGASFLDLYGEINGQNIQRRELYSLSLRPYEEFITLSVEAERSVGNGFDNIKYRYGADLMFNNNISFQFSAKGKDEFKLGLSLPFIINSGRRTELGFDFYGGKVSKNQKFYSGGVSISSNYRKNGVELSVLEKYLFIKFNRKIKEQERANYFTGASPIVFYDILMGIEKAINDDSIKAIMLEIENVGMGFAQIQELRLQLKRFQKTGKKVYVVMTNSGNLEYYLASVADKISFVPYSTFLIPGLSANVYFYKGLMDKVGVKFQEIKHGEYKSYSEGYTRKQMSPEARENITTLLGNLNDQFMKDIQEDRGLSKEEVRKLFESGTLTPEEAKKLSLIDEIAYPSSIYSDENDTKSFVGIAKYVTPNEKNKQWGIKPIVAIIHVDGSIVQGKSNSGIFGESIGNKTYEMMVRKAFKSSFVKGVVIRVSSGGGSAVASDLMWKVVTEMKEKYKKPVVFSFGNVAASGGFYVACTGDKIFASKGTVTGSIGVISGKISLKELYAKLGINKDTVKMGKFADLESESKDLTADELKTLQKSVEFIYSRFTDKVMKARKISKSNLPNAAEGRVFTGEQAKEKKLIDTYGGLILAVNYAAKIAKIEDNYQVVRLLGTGKSFSEMLQSPQEKMLLKLLKPYAKNISHLKYLENKPLYLNPYSIEIK